MNPTELDILESNVKRAVETIKKLSNENQRLKQENQNLLNRINENERTIQQLRNFYQDDGNREHHFVRYQEKEDKIKKKIQQMLDKLEAIQDGSTTD